MPRFSTLKMDSNKKISLIRSSCTPWSQKYSVIILNLSGGKKLRIIVTNNF